MCRFRRRNEEDEAVLRRAENITIRHGVNLFTRQGRVQMTLGRSTYYVGSKLSKDEFRAVLEASEARPAYVGRIKERQYWLFRNRWFWDNDQLTEEQVFALLESRDRRQASAIARAHALANTPPDPPRYRRGAVPRDVRDLVWARDGGRCSHCGSVHELQFDHVIPVARGGSNEPENLQILCGPCNRRKGAAIG